MADSQKVHVNGITVRFPFEPYAIQKEFMSKVLESLQKSQHAALESPTGTGRTVSLLCAISAWLLQEKSKYRERFFFQTPKIIYVTRTHSRITKVIHQLKKTAYNNQITATVLGDRDKMCLNRFVPSDASNMEKSISCKKLLSKNSCSYFLAVKRKSTHMQRDLPINDIEDLCKLGRKHHFCPYYMSKKMASHADIMFISVKYILNCHEDIAQFLNDSVIIFDEAHDIKHVENLSSFSLTSTNIESFNSELKDVIEFVTNSKLNESSGVNETGTKINLIEEDATVALNMFSDFFDVIFKIVIMNPYNGDIVPGDEIFKWLKRAGMNCQHLQICVGVLKNVLDYLSKNVDLKAGECIGNMMVIIQRLIDLWENVEDAQRFFKIHIKPEGNSNKREKTRKHIQFWCLSPNFAISKILQKHYVKNIVFTSGTLSPLNAFVAELHINVPIQLENKHVIEESQLLMKSLDKGYGGIDLMPLTNQPTNQPHIDTACVRSLGLTIKWIVSVVPDGILIYFSTYEFMNFCVKIWEPSKFWKKPFFVEPEERKKFDIIVDLYKTSIDVNRPAILLAVSHDNVSEKLQAKQYSRGIVIVGMLHPSLRDPKVQCKKNYFNDMKKVNRTFLMNGERWLEVEAMRAVNVIIDRFIRRKNDFGAIFLLDKRFSCQSSINDMCPWTEGKLQSVEMFGKMTGSVIPFFNACKNKYQSGSVREPQATNIPTGDKIETNQENTIDNHSKNSKKRPMKLLKDVSNISSMSTDLACNTKRQKINENTSVSQSNSPCQVKLQVLSTNHCVDVKIEESKSNNTVCLTLKLDEQKTSEPNVNEPISSSNWGALPPSIVTSSAEICPFDDDFLPDSGIFLSGQTTLQADSFKPEVNQTFSQDTFYPELYDDLSQKNDILLDAEHLSPLKNLDKIDDLIAMNAHKRFYSKTWAEEIKSLKQSIFLIENEMSLKSSFEYKKNESQKNEETKNSLDTCSENRKSEYKKAESRKNEDTKNSLETSGENRESAMTVIHACDTSNCEDDSDAKENNNEDTYFSQPS